MDEEMQEKLARLSDPTETFVAETVMLLRNAGQVPTVQNVRAELMHDNGLSTDEAQDRIDDALSAGEVRAEMEDGGGGNPEQDAVLVIDEEMECWLADRLRFGRGFRGPDDETALSNAIVAEWVYETEQLHDMVDLVSLVVHMMFRNPMLSPQEALLLIYQAALHGTITVPVVVVEDEE